MEQTPIHRVKLIQKQVRTPDKSYTRIIWMECQDLWDLPSLVRGQVAEEVELRVTFRRQDVEHLEKFLENVKHCFPL